MHLIYKILLKYNCFRNYSVLMYLLTILHITCTDAEIQFALKPDFNPSIGILTAVDDSKINYTIVDSSVEPFNKMEANMACKQMGFNGSLYHESVTSHPQATGYIATLNCSTDQISSCKIKPVPENHPCSECFRNYSVLLRCFNEKSIVFDNDRKPNECVSEGTIMAWNGTFYKGYCENQNSNFRSLAKAVCNNEGFVNGLAYHDSVPTATEADELEYKRLYLDCLNERLEECKFEKPTDGPCTKIRTIRCIPVDYKKSGDNAANRENFCKNHMYQKKKEQLETCLEQCKTIIATTTAQQPPAAIVSSTSPSTNYHCLLVLIGGLLVVLNIVW